MVESLSVHQGRSQGLPTAVGLADPSTEELGLADQPGRGQEGVGSGSPQRAARTALRQRAVVRTDRPEPGPRIHPTPSGRAPKDGSRALSRVGKGRPAGSIELRVSPSPSKIPYGGFSPVRLQMDRQWRPSTTSRGLSAVHIRPMTPSYTPPQFSLPGIRDPQGDYPF